MSGIASCTGPVPDGGPLPTSVPGRFTFDVLARDRAGNVGGVSRPYYVSSGVCEPRPQGLVGWWPGDGHSRDIIARNDGVVVNGSPIFTSGPYSMGFVFIASRYMRVPDTDALRMDNAFTLSAWVYQVRDWLGPFAVIAGREGEYLLARGPNGNVHYAVANADPGWGWIDTGVAMPREHWTKLALTYDGSAIRVYKNGQLVHTRAGSGAIGDAAPDHNEFRVAARESESEPSYFDGTIDDVELVDRAMSAAEIDAAYFSADWGICPVTTTLSFTPAPQRATYGGSAELVAQLTDDQAQPTPGRAGPLHVPERVCGNGGHRRGGRRADAGVDRRAVGPHLCERRAGGPPRDGVPEVLERELRLRDRPGGAGHHLERARSDRLRCVPRQCAAQRDGERRRHLHILARRRRDPAGGIPGPRRHVYALEPELRRCGGQRAADRPQGDADGDGDRRDVYLRRRGACGQRLGDRDRRRQPRAADVHLRWRLDTAGERRNVCRRRQLRRERQLRSGDRQRDADDRQSRAHGERHRRHVRLRCDGAPGGRDGHGWAGEALEPIAFTYNGAADPPIDAGTYAVIGSYAGDGNHLAASGTATLVIDKATPTVAATGGTFTYDGNPHPAGGSVTGVGGAVLGPLAFTYNGAAEAPRNAGTYEVVASFAGNSNYNAASGGATITIAKAAATVTVTGGSFTYDGAAHPATGTVTGVGGATLGPLAFTYNGLEAAPVSAGSYAVVGSYAGDLNYLAASGNATITVGQATPVVSWTAPGAIVYGTPLGSAQLNAAASVAGTFSYAPAAGVVLPAGAGQPLSASFTPADTVNYTGGSVATAVTVVAAPLAVRANDAAKVFGAPLPPFGASFSGFVNGDTPASLGGALTLTTPAGAGSPVGTYPIVPSGPTSPNYAISFVSGALLVVHAQTAVAVSSAPSPSGYEQPMAFTATVAAVAPGAGLPTGVVRFFDGSTLLGSATLAGGSATLTTAGLDAGTRAIAAQYDGDPSFEPGAGTAAHVILPASETPTLTLSSSRNPANVGQSVTLTANVSMSSGPVSGLVEFFDGGTVIGTAAIASGQARLDALVPPSRIACRDGALRRRGRRAAVAIGRPGPGHLRNELEEPVDHAEPDRGAESRGARIDDRADGDGRSFDVDGADRPGALHGRRCRRRQSCGGEPGAGGRIERARDVERRRPGARPPQGNGDLSRELDVPRLHGSGRRDGELRDIISIKAEAEFRLPYPNPPNRIRHSASWSRGYCQRGRLRRMMLLHHLVQTSTAVAAASGRLEKVRLFADLLRRLAPGEIEIAIGFLSGEPRQGRLGIGGAAVWAAKDTPAAEAPGLGLGDVDDAFARLATTKGAGAGAAKGQQLRELLRRATAAEQDFLSRLLFGELRQGALEAVLVDAVARAGDVSSAGVRRAVMMAGALAPVARAALTSGEPGLSAFGIQLFQPVQPMLAQPAADVGEALDRFGAGASLEWKLDGARIQAHKRGGDIRVFSRNLRDVTAAVPEVVEAMHACDADEAIVDGEVIALRPDQAPEPFQVTMQRFGRKLDVARMRAEIPLTPFLFDCLYVNGESLVDAGQEARVERLLQVAPALVVPRLVRPTPEEAARFLDETLNRGHEGLMVKSLDAGYAAGRRGQHWLKVKIARTLDLVILAAEWGHGRRTGWLSNLHLGARDPAHGGFVMLGKTFKGLTDEMLAWQTGRLQALEMSRDRHTVFVRPELVVEVAFNEVQESPQYPGGLALRFARVKAYRPDKPASEADTIEAVREIHRQSIRAR